jgi:hypothetical protein
MLLGRTYGSFRAGRQVTGARVPAESPGSWTVDRRESADQQHLWGFFRPLLPELSAISGGLSAAWDSVRGPAPWANPASRAGVHGLD